MEHSWHSVFFVFEGFLKKKKTKKTKADFLIPKRMLTSNYSRHCLARGPISQHLSTLLCNPSQSGRPEGTGWPLTTVDSAFAMILQLFGLFLSFSFQSTCR